MGSRENFSIFISNLGGNYAVALQNGEIREFFLQSPNNFLEKFFPSGGINCNCSFSRGAETFPRLRDSVPPLLARLCRASARLAGPLIVASQPSGNARSRNTKLSTEISSRAVKLGFVRESAARVGRKSAAPSASPQSRAYSRRAGLSSHAAYRASIQVFDPTSLTATFEKKRCS
jgi:hypothetical protein